MADEQQGFSRRDFLAAAGSVSGSAWLKSLAPAVAAVTQAACSARDAGAGFTTLREREAADFAAIAARIVPTTDTPGASEAGVIYFFDQAFGNAMASSLEFARGGLAELNAGGPRFAERGPEEQDAALRAIESGPFFGLLRFMTIAGFFAMSKYGGNRDQLGWKLIGFPGHQGAWSYPFGHYDRDAHGGSADD